MPAAFVVLAALPLTANGKVDRARPAGARTRAAGRRRRRYAAPRDALERSRRRASGARCSGVERVGVHDNFFDLGGHSLLLVRRCTRRLRERAAAASSPLVDLFQLPDRRARSPRHLASGAAAEAPPARRRRSARRARPARRRAAPARAARRRRDASEPTSDATRDGDRHRRHGRPLPRRRRRRASSGATCATASSRSAVFTDEELRGGGRRRRGCSRDPALRAGAAACSTASTCSTPPSSASRPREAELIDPQHRLFLECAWEALEDAGYDPARYPGAIGVFAGAGVNTYLLRNVLADPELLRAGRRPARRCSATTRTSSPPASPTSSNLRGPSLTVQTACSTSLVAVHLACQSLLSGECDMALAGGVSIALPQRAGYLYQEGGIALARRPLPRLRRRGAAAPSAATAPASWCSSGSPTRSPTATRIHAVIRGSAINNDGAAQGRLHRAERRRPGAR